MVHALRWTGEMVPEASLITILPWLMMLMGDSSTPTRLYDVLHFGHTASLTKSQRPVYYYQQPLNCAGRIAQARAIHQALPDMRVYKPRSTVALSGVKGKNAAANAISRQELS